MHSNYEYVLEKCRQFAPAQGQILDFGCGAGGCVVAGRAEGLDMVGVDIFFEDYLRQAAVANGVLGKCVFETPESRILPFADNRFNFVFCNMVFEHVENIDHTLREIARVLKPGGSFLAVFPGKECFFEGHTCIAFIHWFSKDSRLRYPYMKFMRQMGFGAGGSGKTASNWAQDELRWLDGYTFYRTNEEIESSFGAAGFDVLHMEQDYIAFRLHQRGLNRLARMARLPPLSSLSRLFCRKYGTQVILATKK